MKKDRLQDTFLAELRLLPIVEAVCEKINLSRNSVYRWRKEDPEFRRQMDEALAEGETRLIEVAETQLVSLIQSGHWPAISFILSRRSPKYKERLEISGSLQTNEETLTPEQAAKVSKAVEAENEKLNKKK